MEKRNDLMPQFLDITAFVCVGGGNSNPLNTRVWGSKNSDGRRNSLIEELKAGGIDVWQLIKSVPTRFNRNYSVLNSYASIHPFHRTSKRTAFTMAEILISLTIIGVIAAITLPALQANINEKAWAAKRKALYSRMSQAISIMSNLNGYGIDPTNETNTENNAALAFITNGLSKVLEINNICDREHIKDCGVVSKYKTMTGSRKELPLRLRLLKQSLAGASSFYTFDDYNEIAISISYSLINTQIAAFDTKNGESVVVFYQPLCTDDIYAYSPGTLSGGGTTFYYFQPVMCANFVFDLNGKKGPNQIGKDMGIITAFYPSDSVVIMPIPLTKDSPDENGNYATTYDKALNTCRLVGSDVRLPNKEELESMMINSQLLDLVAENDTNNLLYYAATNSWRISHKGIVTNRLLTQSGACAVRCIQR